MAAETAIEEKILGGIASFEKSDTNYTISYNTGEYAKLSILNNHVFRYYMSPTGQFLDYPTPINETDAVKINIKSVQDYGTHAFDHSVLEESELDFIVQLSNLSIHFDKSSGKLAVRDKRTDQDVLKEQKPLHYNDSISKQTLHQSHDEYFFGGGIQNGRFTHKGEIILIKHPENWGDGCVTCPKPFYWSTKGYGVLRNTWQTGKYDFGSKDQNIIVTDHEEGHFDAFYFINPLPKDILNDYYELTGRPIFLPEYALYESHINTFNIIYWYECGPRGDRVLYCGDNDRYYEPFRVANAHGRNGILGSLNGEKTKYDFSARAIIDLYKGQDMPLGWFVPNNESGYGQTDSLAGDLENLKNFVEYANQNGVEVCLWTDTCLEPKDPQHPEKGERDLEKEVNTGVVALKCDVAWTVKDYSFSLNTLENATKIFVNTSKNNVRPFLLTVDGWAGVQRYAGIATGAQTGGMWEYIRFHIPTYIGAGLSGLPVIGSDMDGIYGGGDIEVYIRDFQWKTFTPLQLNTDGWGRVDKMATSFNCMEAIMLVRAYLKLKSMLMAYNYTISHESLQGLPMVRAMFLEFPQEYPAYTKDSQYQFMWGPSILVAPVYVNPDLNRRPVYVNSSSFYWSDHEFEYQKPKPENEPVRNGIFLPDPGQVWIDLFTGDRYQGGKIYNNLKTPIWKIPVFIKNGAIIPLVNANNNPSEIKRDCRIFLLYPNGENTLKIYEDDGKSSEYLEQKFAETTISVKAPTSNQQGTVSIYIHKTTGSYRNIVKERSTFLQIMASKKVKNIKAVINGKKKYIKRVKTKEEFDNNENVYFFDKKFILNPYLENFDKKDMYQKMLRVKIEQTDVTAMELKIFINGFSNNGNIFGSNSTVIGSLDAPNFITPTDIDVTATTITLRWEINNALYYEIERDENTIISNILGDKLTFKDLNYESKHTFRIRSVNKEGVSKWSDSIVIVTKEEPLTHIVEDVTVSCSIPCEYLHEVINLTKIDRTWWHTEWSWNWPWKYLEEHKMNKTTLSFDLNDVYEIRKIEYVPREDAGNGTFLKIQYRHSVDGTNWTDVSPVISWEGDGFTKVIEMDGAKFKHFELEVLDAVLGHASGKNILFHKM